VVSVTLMLVLACNGDSDGTSDADTARSTPSPTGTPTSSATSIATTTATATPAAASTPAPPTVTDAVYVVPAGERVQAWTLDVYAPNDPAAVPAVVILTGASGSKSNPLYQTLAREIADLGAVVFIPDFPRGDARVMFAQDNATPLREATESAACAIRFARTHAADYGGSSEHVTVIGASAGGAMGLWAALIGDELEAAWDAIATTRGSPLRQLDCVASEGSQRPDAFIGFGGAYDIMELVRDQDPKLAAVLTPATYIGANTDVPLRFINGTLDTVVPAALQARHEALSQTLANAGYDSTWSTIEAGHFLENASIEALIETFAALLD
jgi:acetyl esterase/lipase